VFLFSILMIRPANLRPDKLHLSTGPLVLGTITIYLRFKFSGKQVSPVIFRADAAALSTESILINIVSEVEKTAVFDVGKFRM